MTRGAALSAGQRNDLAARSREKAAGLIRSASIAPGTEPWTSRSSPPVPVEYDGIGPALTE